MQLKVVKSDRKTEDYFHTKVLCTFSNALALIDQSNVFAAEQFAEAITFYLYQKRSLLTITSEEIHLMVQAVLNSTGYENAAKALNDFHLNRKIKRSRIEVIGNDYNYLLDFDFEISLWNKSIIVDDLVKKDGLGRPVARAIASAVEEKVLNIGITKIKKSLVEQLVLSDTDMMLRAQEQLEPATV